MLPSIHIAFLGPRPCSPLSSVHRYSHCQSQNATLQSSTSSPTASTTKLTPHTQTSSSTTQTFYWPIRSRSSSASSMPTTASNTPVKLPMSQHPSNSLPSFPPMQRRRLSRRSSRLIAVRIRSLGKWRCLRGAVWHSTRHRQM
jgi:hypothetical protein